MPLVELLIGGQTQLAQGQDVVLADLTLTSGLIDDLFAGRMTQIFLKQFRETADGTRACYQALVEAPIQIRRVAYSLTERDWSIKSAPPSQPPDRPRAGWPASSAIASTCRSTSCSRTGSRCRRTDPKCRQKRAGM